MRNILGEEGFHGPAQVIGAEKALAIPGVTLHIYGKTDSKPKRKMGHLTATAPTLAEAIERASVAHAAIRIQGTLPLHP